MAIVTSTLRYALPCRQLSLHALDRILELRLIDDAPGRGLAVNAAHATRTYRKC